MTMSTSEIHSRGILFSTYNEEKHLISKVQGRNNCLFNVYGEIDC